MYGKIEFIKGKTGRIAAQEFPRFADNHLTKRADSGFTAKRDQ